jgi:hypothetical protein
MTDAEGIGHIAILCACSGLVYLGVAGLAIGILLFVGWVLYNDAKRKKQ